MYPVMSRYATHAQSIGQLQPVVCRFFDFCLFPNRFWIYRQADNDNFFCNSGKLLLVPYTKDFGRITHF